MSTSNGVNCSCFHGMAVVDKNGNCTCIDTIIGKPDYDPMTTKAVIRNGGGTRRKPRQIIYDVNGRSRTLTTDQIRCRNRQAPSGYHYGMSNGVCVLMTADGKPVQTVAASQTGADVATVPATAIETFIANMQSFVSQNQLLVLAAVGGIGYFLLKKR